MSLIVLSLDKNISIKKIENSVKLDLVVLQSNDDRRRC